MYDRMNENYVVFLVERHENPCSIQVKTMTEYLQPSSFFIADNNPVELSTFRTQPKSRGEALSKSLAEMLANVSTALAIIRTQMAR